MSLVTRGLGEPQALVTRGLAGAFVGVPPLGGGVVVEEAEMVLTDLAIIEELITSVEEALAPVVEEFLTEVGLEISTWAASTLDIQASANNVTAVELSAEALQITPVEELLLDLAASESPTLTFELDESSLVQTETDASERITIEDEHGNAGDYPTQV